VLLLVARLLLVYFGTAALCLFLAHRFVRSIRFRACLFLALGPFLLTGRALLTAGVYAPLDIAYQGEPLASYRAEMGIGPTRSPILTDVVYQEIPWRKAAREALENGRLPLWNRFQLAGEPLLAVQQPALLHPATWIGLLLPLAQAWTFEMAFRFLLALLCAYLFFRELGCGEVASSLGAVAWAFCDFLVFWLGYPLTPAAAPFPLLLLGLKRLVSEADARSVALTVVALLLIVTSGHPETLLHAVAGAGVFFLFELGAAARGRRLRSLLLSLLAGAIALGLSAVLLLPLFEALPHTFEHALRTSWYAHVDRSVDLRPSLSRGVQNIVPYAFGPYGHGRLELGFQVSSYAGSLLFPLALAGLISSSRRERWPIFLTGLIGVCVGAQMPVVADAVAALPLFDIAINERLAVLGAFALATLAALGAQRLLEGHGRAPFLAGALLAAAAIALLFARVRDRLLSFDMPEDSLRARVLLQILPLLLSAALVAIFARSARKRAVVGAFLLVLLLVQRGIEAGEIYPTFRSKAFYPALDFLDPIPRREPYRVVAVGYTFIPNVSALYGLEDVRGYEAMTFFPLLETAPLWCVPQPVWYNRVDDPTRPFLSFLNVRWVIAPPGYPAPKGWEVVSEGKGGRLLENPSVLPRAFVPRRVRFENDAGRQLETMKAITDFGADGVVEADGGPGDPTRLNGKASVRIVSYLPQRMELEIEAKEIALIATSVTRWPGWRLSVDGREGETLVYNRAFLAFRVPPGRHRAVLTYSPESFTRGGLLSAGALLLGAGVLIARRNRRIRR
jgi:Bacterial membrane protein YfhO